MKRILLIATLFLYMGMEAQTFEWLKAPALEGTNFHNTPYTTVADPSGNIYFTGFKNSPVVIHDVMGNIFYDKYNTEGELLFSKEFTGKCTVYNILSDSQGNIIMALGYTETLTIGTTTLTSLTDDKTFTCKT